MLDFPIWKRLLLWAITIAFAAMALPSLVSIAGGKWPASLPNPRIQLGLDLAGGSQLLLEAQPTQVAKQRMDSMEESVRAKLREANPRINIGDMTASNGTVSFVVQDPSRVDAARGLIEPLTNGVKLSGKRDWTIQVVDGNRFVLSQTKEGLQQAIGDAMDSATEVVRKRIDALGTKEPTIVREGASRIMVQVPGLQNPQALKDLLGKTASLDFKLVDQAALPSDIAQGIAPPGDEIVPCQDARACGGAAKIAVKRLGGIHGDQLTNAQQGFESRTNVPIVNITFDAQGGAKFAQLTTENVNKPFAIVLDGVVISAPNINEPILGGQAQISGSFTVQSANALAISLRSGALPVNLTVIDERTVGPDLGADSIHKGVIAMIVGTAIVVLLIAATYGRFGLYADIAVLINVLMILGVMALLNITLTLPGIAGFVLTIGAAVDANVLINERIGEERRRGRKVVQAVDLGYKEASRTIFEANVTHAIAGFIMLVLGSGPVRGFAVVLLFGIATSVFTAVVFTRMLVTIWLRRNRPSEIHI